MELAGRTALVTGASTGIGAATARLLARRGARVLLVARSEDKLAALAGEIGTEAAFAFPCDVSDHHAVGALGRRVSGEHGTPDVIVNNAGAGRFRFIEETDPDEFLAMTAVPYQAAFFVTRAFIEGMIARGSGWVVNVNTPIALLPWPGAIGYGGARWALRGFDAALRAELRGTGVGVSHVVPAKVASEYFEHNPGAEERIPQVARIIPTLSTEQVAEAICRAVERERREVIEPFVLRLLLFQARFLPRLTEWVLWRTGARRSP